jgi:hypothetical protein
VQAQFDTITNLLRSTTLLNDPLQITDPSGKLVAQIGHMLGADNANYSGIWAGSAWFGGNDPSTSNIVIQGGGVVVNSSAPNVTSATGAAYYEPNGSGGQDFGFSGVITLPTASPTYGNLKTITVIASLNGIGYVVAMLSSPWVGSTAAYSGIIGVRPSSNQTGWGLAIWVADENGVPTANPVTVPANYPVTSLTVSAGSNPSATGISAATAGPSTTMGPNSEGQPYWSIPVTFTTPGATAGGDQNCRKYQLTVNIVDSSGNEAPQDQGGGEVLVGNATNDGGVSQIAPLVAGFNPAGSIYTYAQLKLYGIGLLPTDEWNSGTRTLQQWTGTGGAPTSVLVNFGQPPAGVIPPTRFDPSGLGTGLGKDPITNKLLTQITGPLYADVNNNINIRLAGDFTVTGSPPTLSQYTVNLAKAVNFNTTNFTTTGGSMAINAVAVNQLIAGNALFTGQAQFASQTGGIVTGVVTINYSGVAIGNALTSPTYSITLQATGPTPGVTIASGANSFQANASGFTIADSSGNSLTTRAVGTSIVRGTTSLLLAASGMLVTDGYGNTLNMGAAGLIVQNVTGGVVSSVTVAASGVTILRGALTSPTINGGSLTISTSTSVVAINNTTQGIDVALSGPAYVGFYLHYATGNSVQISAGGGLSGVLVRSSYGYLGSYGAGYLTLTDSVGTSGIDMTGQVDGAWAITMQGTRGLACYKILVGAGGVSCTIGQIACQSLLIGGSTSINSSNQFVGAGVYCPGYAVAGLVVASYSPYLVFVGGTPYSGRTTTFQDLNGNWFTVRGGIITSG